jgi:hypothetical protein
VQHFPLRLATRHLPTITCRLPQFHAELELEKLCLHQLNAAAKDFMAAGGGATPLAALALACLPAEHAAEAVDSSAAGGEEAGSDAGGCRVPGCYQARIPLLWVLWAPSYAIQVRQPYQPLFL